jgi:hypothetical protein
MEDRFGHAQNKMVANKHIERIIFLCIFKTFDTFNKILSKTLK